MATSTELSNNAPQLTVGERITDAVSRLGILGELLRFLWQRRLWWLIPMIIALIIFGVIIALGASGVLSPFIYSIL